MSLLHFKNRLKQHALWIWKGKYHLLSIITSVITFCYLSGFLRFFPNTVALFMTLAGLLILLTQQIFDTIKFSSHNPNTFMNWIKAYPTGKPIILSGSCVMSAAGSLKAHITSSITTDATLEKKITFILRQLETLDSAITKIDEKVDSINSSLNKTEEKLQASLDTVTTTLNTVIASHVVGTYDLNLLAVNLTICGTVIQFFFSGE